MFDRLGATKMVLIVLSDAGPNLDSDLLIEFLSFINLLLEGGNNQI